VTGNIHPISVDFFDLPADRKASILLFEGNSYRWCSAGLKEGGVRFCVESPSASPISIRRLIINGREISVETYGGCSLIRNELCVYGEGDDVRGIVDLPPGASVILRSSADIIHVIDQSSFSLSLKVLR
jgi:hypothetical protein